MTPLIILLAAAIGYLLGSIPFGLVLTRLAGLGDIREIGSGNIGATNVLRTGRKDLALGTFLLDSGKAGIAYAIAAIVFSPSAGLIAGAAAFLGHCYPVWLKFKGGKGAATYAGLIFAAFWQVGLLAAAVWLTVAAVFRMSSLAAITAATLVPIFAWWLGLSQLSVGVLVFLTVLVYIRHHDNIRRILTGTESKIGQRS